MATCTKSRRQRRRGEGRRGGSVLWRDGDSAAQHGDVTAVHVDATQAVWEDAGDPSIVTTASSSAMT